jgi:hypothetical protein
MTWLTLFCSDTKEYHQRHKRGINRVWSKRLFTCSAVRADNETVAAAPVVDGSRRDDDANRIVGPAAVVVTGAIIGRTGDDDVVVETVATDALAREAVAGWVTVAAAGVATVDGTGAVTGAVSVGTTVTAAVAGVEVSVVCRAVARAWVWLLPGAGLILRPCWDGDRDRARVAAAADDNNA